MPITIIKIGSNGFKNIPAEINYPSPLNARQTIAYKIKIFPLLISTKLNSFLHFSIKEK